MLWSLEAVEGEEGKTVFTEKIYKQDIIYTNITFTPGKRLPPATVTIKARSESPI